MNDEQFRAIRGLLVTVVILLSLTLAFCSRWRGSTCEQLTPQHTSVVALVASQPGALGRGAPLTDRA
jgi:hypothetical protein